MTIWKKFKALASGIEFNRQVPRHPAHLWYVLLTVLSILAALVMHGSVHYTLLTALLVFPLGLVVYIPYRYFNILSRMLLNTVIFGAGCFWCMYRLKQNIPIDKMLVETLSLWCLTFLVSGKSKGYFYLLFIDILLLLYGALLPRLFSLYLTIAAFGVLLILLARNRTGYLSGDMLLPTPPQSYRRTWHIGAVFLLLSAVAFYFVFGLIPLTDNGLEGLVPVSFTTERNSFASPELQEWLKSGLNKKNGPDSQKTDENVSGESVTLTKDSAKGKTLQLPKPPPDAPVVPGDGGSQQGKDLVFRVKSPLKLYHLSRLYDQYDGKYWRVSWALKRTRDRKGEENAPWQTVKLSYFQEKLFSKTLAVPWKLISFHPDDTNGLERLRILQHYWGVELEKTPQVMPFKFSVTCELPRISVNSGKVVPLPWPETAHKHTYLSLPPHKISRRVRLLAQTLTAGITSPYAKAIALRDFLRSNYKYKLEAAPTPPHRESVDYFIFYLGEGHCEYFASALTVLARCAGLPARVATGFSPGNYNTLTSLFEVFEYHAHAWTQIYIPEYGWLTFDATPPSAIVSETSPPGFGKMRDPFGDEWRIRPPELTDRTLDYMQKKYMLEERKKQGESNVEQALNEIAAAGDQLKEELSKEHNKNPNPVQLKKERKKGVFDLRSFRLKAAKLFRQFQQSLVKFALYVVSSWTRLLTAIGILAAVTGMVIGLVKLFKRMIKVVQFLWLCRKSRHFSDPRAALRSCCHAALALLQLNDMPRNGNQELLEYSAALRSDIAAECKEIFTLFYRSEYRAEPPDRDEAEKGARHLQALRKCFKRK
ncbi:MAG: transglutaminase domain-containing protein [Lentisphaeria bacterium]|nr:transglutaminase domain-containing protein [Lentisphaeria bacterium]